MTTFTFIHFPSSDDAKYDFYALAPDGMKKTDAKTTVISKSWDEYHGTPVKVKKCNA